jgi:uncharacterized membrane protein YraQ (UPF0718 family)
VSPTITCIRHLKLWPVFEEETVETRAATLDAPIPFAIAGSLKTRLLAIVLLMGIAASFWVGSRYPALYKKYSQGQNIKVTGAITFGTVYAVDRSMPLRQRVWRTTVNWLQANEIGMTFGFFFGAAALTFVSMLPRRRTENRYMNALIGMVTGAPLGVCANCVAPIGRGLYASGMSTESVLAAMFSSPTLNVIVLAMAFALFPLPVVGLKLATVALLILVIAPLAAKLKFETAAANCPASIPPVSIAEEQTWVDALRTTAVAYAKSFWYVFKIGIPLMLLAAFLGALVIELVPQNALLVPVSFAGIVLVAVIGTFLPVPMAFDVVIAYLAMRHGVPLPYVVTLLCTLGIFSIYSFAMVGKTISWKIAAAVYSAVAFFGAVAGLATRIFR